MSWRFFTPVRIALLIGALVSVLCWKHYDYLSRIDMRAMDFRLLQRGPIEPLPNIVIVAVDNESLAQVGRWVWPRAVIAELIRRISAANPKVIALDIVFSEPSDFNETSGLTARPKGVSPEQWNVTQSALRAQDQALAEAIRESGRVVLGYALDLSPEATKPPGKHLTTYNWWKGKGSVRKMPGAIVNLPEIEQAGRASGYFNIFPDEFDGLVRRMPLALQYDDNIRMPLALAALRVAIPNTPLSLKFNNDTGDVDSVNFGPIVIPVAEDGQLLINYRGRGETFPHISAADVLRGEVPVEQLRDKIVVVGVTATAVFDIRSTPFDEVFPGVEIHANVIDNILKGDFIQRPKILVITEMATVLILAMILGIAMIRARGVAAAITAVAMLMAR